MLRKKNLYKKYHTLILLPLGTVVLLSFCVIFFGFGLNNKLFNSSLEGYIFDVNKRPIVGANVCIQDQCVSTRENGFYQIQNLRLGSENISVSSEKHLNFIESIKIDTGINNLSVELTEATLANVTIRLTDGNGIQADNLEIRLNDKELTEQITNTDKNTQELKLDQKKTGLYDFTIISSYYVDQKIDLIIEPDIENSYDIYLEPASNFNIYVQDWINSTPLENTQVIIQNDQELETDKNGQLVINEFSVYEKEIIFKKEGFLKQKLTLTNLQPGANPDITIKLIPDGKMAFAKETSLGKQIFLSNYDGSELHQLTIDGINSNPWIDETNEKVYFLKSQLEKTSLVYWVDLLGEETKMISTKIEEPPKEPDKVNYRKDVRIFLRRGENEINIIKTKLDDSKEIVLADLTGRELKDSILSKDGSQFIFSFVSNDETLFSQDGIYTNNIRFNRTTNILKFNTGEARRISLPKAASDDGEILALTIDGELFAHKSSGQEIERITNDTLDKSNFDFQPETERISYIRIIEDRKELVLVDPNSKEMQILTQTSAKDFNYQWLKKELFYYVIDGELWISSLKNIESPQLVDKQVTF